MEAARLPQRRLGADRGQLLLVALLLVLAAVSWLVTDKRMGGMESTPGMDLGSLGFYTTVWVVMMAAMMFPSVAPTVLTYNRLREGHRAAAPDATALFVAGYLIVWSAVGVAAYGLLELGREISPGWLAWDQAGRWVTGGVIVVAAIYQLTPAKETCLVKCRSPYMFLAERWEAGRLGALKLGAAHGAWCVGCCWALMAALFAVGVMSLGWMAVIAAFIAAEKLLPWPRAARFAVGAALLVLGLGVAMVPGDVPGFSEPQGDHDAMQMSR